MAIDRYSYPFTAIVGQEQMKLALVLNAINPAIGGVLIRGEKGTGKSTAVRALAKLLPEQQVVEGCRFGCHPDDPEDSDIILYAPRVGRVQESNATGHMELVSIRRP